MLTKEYKKNVKGKIMKDLPLNKAAVMDSILLPKTYKQMPNSKEKFSNTVSTSLGPNSKPQVA